GAHAPVGKAAARRGHQSRHRELSHELHRRRAASHAGRLHQTAPQVKLEERVFIAGAGPVGLSAAAPLVARGIAVKGLAGSAHLSEESRASTFHPPTLDMLEDLGAARDLTAQGLTAAKFQYRSKRDGVIAEFDFGAIADLTRHPYRVQAEQFK